MKEQRILVKRIVFLLKLLRVYVTALLSLIYKTFFTKRTLMLVTKRKIRSITVGPVSQLSLLLVLFWVGSIFIQSLQYNKILDGKSEEIARLKSLNDYFSEEFDSVQDKLAKVNEYLLSVNGAKREVKHEENRQEEFHAPNSIKGKDILKEEKRTLNQIKDIDGQINNIRSIAKSRIKKVENAISIAGLNIKKIPNSVANKKLLQEPVDSHEADFGDFESSGGQGGPLEDEIANSLFNQEESLDRRLKKEKFSSEIDYLIVLEKLVRVAPFSKPMKNYYISSGFGSRADPITGRGAVHRGLDFVGVSKEKIISPSEGKIVLAKRFSGYGNAIVIDHGFGITTRYGHLDAIKVQEGQMVKKGDVIAVQGNTGRSTGPHLHYEVRYKNIPLNPRKFLEAGNYMFNDKNDALYVRS